jgi:uncharacterized LabA/DUF88 family protein
MAIIKHPEQRVAVFIDTQNVYHSAKNIYHARANFGNILKDAVAGRKLVRARAYAVTTESGEEKGFFEALEKIGIEMRLKELQVFAGGAKKADWDVGMAVDAITAAPKVDAVVLVTGDGDFVPLVEYLQQHDDCQVEVLSFGRSTSLKLKEACDEFIDLDKDPRRYLIGSRSTGSRRGGGRSTSSRQAAGSTRDVSVSAPEDSIAPEDDAREAGKITGVE